MFGFPTTPKGQTRPDTWPRYISTTPTSFTPLSSDLFTQPHSIHVHSTPTLTPSTARLSSSHSCSSPAGLSDTPSSSPHTHGGGFESIQTPFVKNNSGVGQGGLTVDDLRIHSSSTAMPLYPETPSPPTAYGINGSLILNAGNMMSAALPGHHHPGTVASCTPSVPAQHDVFLSSHHVKPAHHRPALRPTLSHNAVHPTPIPAGASRRMMPPTTTTVMTSNEGGDTSATHPSTTSSTTTISGEADCARPSTAGSILDNNSTVHAHFDSTSSSTNPSSQGPSHSVPIPVPTPTHEGHSNFATLSSSAPAHTYNMGVATPSQYGEDLSFNTSYASYDSSFSSDGSSWTGQPCFQQHPMHQPRGGYGGVGTYPYMAMYQQASGREVEPILEPGEVPAPRPPASYAALIGEALLLASPPHQLYVSEISDSIKKRYSYYRQNPSKVYNGVRHQTSMCKAFVKLPRPFGDQSGGARKWAIRAGCETWFQGGGYHPPGTTSPVVGPTKGRGKAKATARAKQLAIGIASPPDRKSAVPYDSGPWSAGPSNGPAFDGSSKPYYPPPHPSHYASSSYPPPGYHYVPIQPGHGPQPVYVPVWGPYGAPPPPPLGSSSSTTQSTMHAPPWSRSNGVGSASSPESWRMNRGIAPSEHGSHHSYDDKGGSPGSLRGRRSPQGVSPRRR